MSHGPYTEGWPKKALTEEEGAEVVLFSDAERMREALEGIPAFFQEALDETDDMELPHALYALRVKVASRIACLGPTENQ